MSASALLAVVILVATPAPKEAPEVEASVKKIKELQKERLATLEKLVDQTAARFQRAQGSYEEVLEAQMQLLQARLDDAEKESDRIGLYQKAIELLKQTEKVARAHVEAGRETERAVLKVQARRLEVEILLERAKIKEAGEKK